MHGRFSDSRDRAACSSRGDRVESSRRTSMSSSASLSCWSFISAINGDTTSVTPSSSSAGS